LGLIKNMQPDRGLNPGRIIVCNAMGSHSTILAFMKNMQPDGGSNLGPFACGANALQLQRPKNIFLGLTELLHTIHPVSEILVEPQSFHSVLL